MKIKVLFLVFLFSLLIISIQDFSYAAVEAQELVVKVNDIKIKELENSKLLRIELNIFNGGDEEASFFANNFDLLDRNLRQYGSTSGYELRDRGESVSRGICDTLFGENVNPGLSVDLEICFEVPKNNFQYDSILIYDNMFSRDMD